VRPPLIPVTWPCDPQPPGSPAGDAVVSEMERLNPRRRHHRPALRHTFDQLYDGARTRRCRLGPAVQDREDPLRHARRDQPAAVARVRRRRGARLLHRRAQGRRRYSQSHGGWMLPPEAIGELCMVVTASDQLSHCCYGVVDRPVDLGCLITLVHVLRAHLPVSTSECPIRRRRSVARRLRVVLEPIDASPDSSSGQETRVGRSGQPRQWRKDARF
jgi:hypothetical protein